MALKKADPVERDPHDRAEKGLVRLQLSCLDDRDIGIMVDWLEAKHFTSHEVIGAIRIHTEQPRGQRGYDQLAPLGQG